MSDDSNVLTREALIIEESGGSLRGLKPPPPEAPDADTGGGGPGQEEAEADGGHHRGQVQPQQRGEAGARAHAGAGLVLAVATVRGSVTNLEIIMTWRDDHVTRRDTYQVLADADVGVTSERISTAKGLWVLESRDDEVESVVGGPPAVGVIPQGHEVGPGDDEPVTAHAQRLRVTRDVRLER